jgi:hypothetical protein
MSTEARNLDLLTLKSKFFLLYLSKRLEFSKHFVIFLDSCPVSGSGRLNNLLKVTQLTSDNEDPRNHDL